MKLHNIDVFELIKEKPSLSTIIKFKHDVEEKNNVKPKLKHKYIRFEVEKGEHSFSLDKIVGFYYKQDEKDKNKVKEIKDYIFSSGTNANNVLLSMLIPALNGIAFENLSLFLNDQKEYFENK